MQSSEDTKSSCILLVSIVIFFHKSSQPCICCVGSMSKQACPSRFATIFFPSYWNFISLQYLVTLGKYSILYTPAILMHMCTLWSLVLLELIYHHFLKKKLLQHGRMLCKLVLWILHMPKQNNVCRRSWISEA